MAAQFDTDILGDVLANYIDRRTREDGAPPSNGQVNTARHIAMIAMDVFQKMDAAARRADMERLAKRRNRVRVTDTGVGICPAPGAPDEE